MLLDYIKMKAFQWLELFNPIEPTIVHVESSSGDLVDQIFRTVHAANSVMRKLNNEEVEDINDVSEERKEGIKKAILDTLASESITPEESHTKWLEAHQKMGYKYGVTIDHDKKLHPCMVPYEFLPPLQKAKDEMFGAIVNSFKEKLPI